MVSLVTGFPRRSKFFAGELEHFLILSKENNLESTAILGSYAGAVGFPQFISSSYRNYAIDFNDDGSTDLINQVDDAIGNSANYFIENGWKPGQPVTSEPINQVDQRVQNLANTKRKVQYSAKDLRNSGAELASVIQDAEKLGVLMLDSSEIVHDEKSSGTYVVRAGDTACQIAERLSVSCKKLFSLNKLNANGDIYRGQKLKIPGAAVHKKKSEKSDSRKWQVNADKQANEEKELVDGPQPVYFYTHHNFYAITKYNHSVLYAMAVHDLSQAILKKYESNHASSSES